MRQICTGGKSALEANLNEGLSYAQQVQEAIYSHNHRLIRIFDRQSAIGLVRSPPWDHEQQVIAEVMPTESQLQTRLAQLAERVRDAERDSVISPTAEREFVEAKIAFRSGNYFVAMQHLTAAERALPKRSMHPIDNRVAR